MNLTRSQIRMRFAWAITIAGVVVILLSLTGCTSAVGKVAASQNSYDFFYDRLPQVCKAHKEPDFCKRYVGLLNSYEHDLHLAARALKAGGKLPKQLKAIQEDEKAVEKVAK